MTIKLLLLNGPPRSGKDTALRAITSHHWTPNILVAPERMSLPIKAALSAFLNDEYRIDYTGNLINPDETEPDKETPHPILGISLRQWQIDFSERFMKPLYGQNIFARLLLQRLEDWSAHNETILVVLPDIGFQIEFESLLATGHDTLLLRLMRPDTSFEGDSREYISPYTESGTLRCQYEIILNHDLATFEARILDATRRFLIGDL